jgi:hypothetical protein
MLNHHSIIHDYSASSTKGATDADIKGTVHEKFKKEKETKSPRPLREDEARPNIRSQRSNSLRIEDRTKHPSIRKVEDWGTRQAAPKSWATRPNRIPKPGSPVFSFYASKDTYLIRMTALGSSSP